jgi:hypothetical protein
MIICDRVRIAFAVQLCVVRRSGCGQVLLLACHQDGQHTDNYHHDHQKV